jgi:pSer/pThr/pTyr-binding forkhead associated (FHA) protein
VPPAQAPTAPEPAAQAVPAYQRAQLVVERGTGRPQSLTLLAEQEVVIGRGPQANLVLDDQRVSARHAQICFRENGFMIVDLHSRNGLLVNNYRVDKLRLQHNDRVQLGETVLVFQQPREMGEG